MKIILATPNSGGPITYSNILLEKLPQHGYEIELINFQSVEKYPKLIRHLIYFFKLIKSAKQADTIYAQDPVSTGLPAYFAAKFSGKRFFLKIVGDYAWEQGVQRFGVKENLDDFVNKSEYNFFVKTFRYIERFVASGAEKIIVPSNYLKGIVEKWGIDSQKIEVIYNAVYFNKKGKESEDVKKLKRPIVITVGRLVPWKNIDKVIDAVYMVRKEGKDLSLVIVGDGPERKILEDHAKNLLKEGYVFTGNITHEDVLATMESSDIFVLNSSYEGLSHVFIEALSLGLPSIVTDVGGNSEIASENESIKISLNDNSGLTSSLSSLVSDSARRSSLSAVAKESAKRFSVENMVKRLVTVLR